MIGWMEVGVDISVGALGVCCLSRLLCAVKQEHSFTLALMEAKGGARHKTITLIHSFTSSTPLWWLEDQCPECRPFRGAVPGYSGGRIHMYG